MLDRKRNEEERYADEDREERLDERKETLLISSFLIVCGSASRLEIRDLDSIIFPSSASF